MTVPLRTERLMNSVTVRGPGHRSPQTLLMHDESDRLIREAAITFFPGASKNATAKRLHRAISRYSCSAWQRERAELTCPSRLHDRLDGFCWRLLKTVNRVPGESRIRQIISRGPIR